MHTDTHPGLDGLGQGRHLCTPLAVLAFLLLNIAISPPTIDLYQVSVLFSAGIVRHLLACTCLLYSSTRFYWSEPNVPGRVWSDTSSLHLSTLPVDRRWIIKLSLAWQRQKKIQWYTFYRIDPSSRESYLPVDHHQSESNVRYSRHVLHDTRTAKLPHIKLATHTYMYVVYLYIRCQCMWMKGQWIMNEQLACGWNTIESRKYWSCWWMKMMTEIVHECMSEYGIRYRCRAGTFSVAHTADVQTASKEVGQQRYPTLLNDD